MEEIFESGELTTLVGIKPFYLNKFLERSLYGIKPTVRSGKLRQRRRLFNRDDVYGVALVWWLFESGLRGKTVQFVLNQIIRRVHTDANSAARRLLGRKVQFLVVIRRPRSANEQDAAHPRQRVELVDLSQVTRIIQPESTESKLVIPVGKLFSTLAARIDASQSSTG